MVTYPIQTLDGRIPILFPPALGIVGIELVFILARDVPEMLACSNGHVDDFAGLDIHGSRIEFATSVLFWSDIGGRAVETSGHVRFFLPGHVEGLSYQSR